MNTLQREGDDDTANGGSRYYELCVGYFALSHWRYHFPGDWEIIAPRVQMYVRTTLWTDLARGVASVPQSSVVACAVHRLCILQAG